MNEKKTSEMNTKGFVTQPLVEFVVHSEPENYLQHIKEKMSLYTNGDVCEALNYRALTKINNTTALINYSEDLVLLEKLEKISTKNNLHIIVFFGNDDDLINYESGKKANSDEIDNSIRGKLLRVWGGAGIHVIESDGHDNHFKLYIALTANLSTQPISIDHKSTANTDHIIDKIMKCEKDVLLLTANRENIGKLIKSLDYILISTISKRQNIHVVFSIDCYESPENLKYQCDSFMRSSPGMLILRTFRGFSEETIKIDIDLS